MSIPTDTIILKSFDEWALYFSLKERALQAHIYCWVFQGWEGSLI